MPTSRKDALFLRGMAALFALGCTLIALGIVLSPQERQ